MNKKSKPECQLKWNDSKCVGKVLSVIVDSNDNKDAFLYSCTRHNYLYRSILTLHQKHNIAHDHIKTLSATEIQILHKKLG